MSERQKYFIINKESDFRRGIMVNMRPEWNRLTLLSEDGAANGRFMTRIFDGGEKEALWHRLLISGENFSRSGLRVTVFCTDRREFLYGGKEYDIFDAFSDKSSTFEEKKEIFGRFAVKKVSGASDILLNDICGRYVWVLAEIFGGSALPAAVTEIKLFLYTRPWIEELPHIYRDGDRRTGFLERFLSVFQTFYDEITDVIASSADNYDPQCAPADYLGYIAEWLDIPDARMWSENGLRKYLSEAVRLYRMRGTREGLSRILELFTGEKPYIIENSDIMRFKGTDTYENTLLPLYGNDPYRATILIKSSLVNNETELHSIRKLVSEMLPVFMEMKIVLTEPYIFLGKFSYMGINSVIGSYKPAVLDGSSPIALSILQQTRNSSLDTALPYKEDQIL